MRDEERPNPRALGYRMPAEWERHDSTWIGWPHNQTDWPGRFGPVPWVYGEIVRHLAPNEIVHIIVENRFHQAEARKVLAPLGLDFSRIVFHRWKTNRGWLRDSGPIFIHGTRGIAVTNWQFSAWAKYDDWELDDKLPHLIAKLLGLPEWMPQATTRTGRARHVVLEGGSIDVNGLGTLLTTEECLLGKTQMRNPRVDREELERVFREYLAAPHVIWLEAGIAGDDTHGHIDDIARFVGPRTVMATVESDRRDVNHEILRKNLQQLKRSTDQDGKSLELVELPMPRPVIFRGQRLPASYANFYLANNVVLAPVFNDPNDRFALDILTRVFRDRAVMPIYCGDLIWGLGAIHCMTQQQPAE